MEAWKRNDEVVVVEDDGLEKKHIDRRNDYGTSSADEYHQQILEKTQNPQESWKTSENNRSTYFSDAFVRNASFV